jgi:hypothetical protein
LASPPALQMTSEIVLEAPKAPGEYVLSAKAYRLARPWSSKSKPTEKYGSLKHRTQAKRRRLPRSFLTKVKNCKGKLTGIRGAVAVVVVRPLVHLGSKGVTVLLTAYSWTKLHRPNTTDLSTGPGVPFVEVDTLAKELRQTTANERLTTLLSSLFSGIAALLAGVGICGLFAYIVTHRRREIGIRMA